MCSSDLLNNVIPEPKKASKSEIKKVEIKQLKNKRVSVPTQSAQKKPSWFKQYMLDLVKNVIKDEIRHYTVNKH